MKWHDFIIWLKQHRVGEAIPGLGIYVIYDAELEALLREEQEVEYAEERKE